MALVKCPDCGREISNRAKACIHCGCPIEDVEDLQEVQTGTLMVNLDKSNGVLLTPYEKNVDIVTADYNILCTLNPGETKVIPIENDITIYASRFVVGGIKLRKKMLEAKLAGAGSQTVTDPINVPAKGITRIQVTHVPVLFGLGCKTVMNIVDVIDSY